MYLLLRREIFGVLSMVSIGCEAAPAPNDPGTGSTRVVIVPGAVEVEPGASRTLQAQVYSALGAQVPNATVNWTSTNSSVASIAPTGVVLAKVIGNATVIASSEGAADTVVVRVVPPAPAGNEVTIYPEVTYQVMTGWEGVAQIGEVECNPQAFNSTRNELIQRLVNELGINRVRLELRSGHENPQDYFTPFLTSRQASDWNPHRYESVNDNNDPRVIRQGGFQFAELDDKVNRVIKPLQAALSARGERLYLNLNYVDFDPSSWEQSSDPEEYAELLLAAFQHLQSRHGLVPDAVEMILEPDNTANCRARR